MPEDLSRWDSQDQSPSSPRNDDVPTETEGTIICVSTESCIDFYFPALALQGLNQLVAGSQVVSILDYVGGLPIKSSILPLLKHACGEQWTGCHADH